MATARGSVLHDGSAPDQHEHLYRPTRAGAAPADVGAFFALTYGFSWLLWGIILVLGLQPFAFPGVVLLLAGGFGPSLAGVALTRWRGSPAERAVFWSRLVSPRRTPPVR